MSEVATLGIAGTGLIGSGWAARALARGLDVVAYDPAPAAEAPAQVGHRRRLALHDRPARRRNRRRPAGSPSPPISPPWRAADFIQEAAPEREDLKIALFRDIDAAARPTSSSPRRRRASCPPASSRLAPTRPASSSATPSTRSTSCRWSRPWPASKTAPEAMDRAGAFYESIGMRVLRLKREIDGYICDRLQEALWREALHCLDKGVGSTGDIDDAIVFSAGLRWAFMGSFMTYHLAGGPGGMRDFIKQFDPTLELPWTDLKFPKWSDELTDKLVEGCEAQAQGKPVAAWEAKRDAVLVDLIEVLHRHGLGAGTVLGEGSQAPTRRSASRRLPPPQPSPTRGEGATVRLRLLPSPLRGGIGGGGGPCNPARSRYP
jgi:carnitine 3-dehydrogenase